MTEPLNEQEQEERRMLRQRRKEESSFSPEPYVEEKQDMCTESTYKIPSLLAAAVIICSWILLYSVAVYFSESLPPLRQKSDATYSNDRFVGERAKEFLIKLASIGVKTTGSYENEVKAAKLIENEIRSIMDQAKDVNAISYDRQISSGGYYLEQRGGSLFSAYDRVQNLVVKIGPPYSSSPNATASVLVNCHFDSAPSSPGASDDGLNCAVMLEVFRLLSQQNEVLKNSVVFLFNGAEETPLQASHGFITQQKWAKDVKAFINLESCGAGGKEALFQTGPQHPWLVQLYKEAAEHPFGLVLAEDVFQGGLVPSDTDFRIFRDYGHVPGLDFAHCDNGYVYHTKFDDIDRIKDGVYQHTGDNILALVKHFLSSEILVNSKQYSEGRTVYFDLGGLYLVTYSETTGIILNLATVLLSLYTILQNVCTYTTGMRRTEFGKQLGMCLLVPLLGLVLALIFVISIAVILDATNSVLSWYSKPYLILPLYFAPTLAAFCLPPLLLGRPKSSNLNDAVRVQLYCNGVQFLWTVGLFIAILTGLRSAYILMITVLITAICNCLLTILNLQRDVPKWLIGYCISTIIPALYFVYIYILATRLFIPITGRSGPNINPELFIGVISALLCSLVFAYIMPLIILVWKPWRFVCGLLIINVFTLFLIIVTPVGFPFAENTPQRILALHVSRDFYNEAGAVVKNDSGVWFMHIDRRAPETYKAIPWFKFVANNDADCSNYLYCGLPYYYTRIASVERNPGSWVPGPSPVFDKDTHLQLNSISDISSDTKRFKFTVSGPHQMLLFLSPKEGVKLTDWNFGNEKPTEGLYWGSRPTYIVRFTTGGFPNKPELVFHLDLQIQSALKLPSYVDVAVAGHYIQETMNKNSNFMKYFESSPLSWAHITAWSASFKSYVF